MCYAWQMAERFAIVIMLLILPWTAVSQESDDPPDVPLPEAAQCRAEIEGQLSCQASRVCECVFKTAVPARNLPDRWAWDCGIKRPSCDIVPASPGDLPELLPPVYVDKSDHRDHPHPPKRPRKKDEPDPPR